MPHPPVFSIEAAGQKFVQVVLSPASKGIFSEQLDSLLQEYDTFCKQLGINGDNLVLAKIFLSDYANQKEIFESHPFFSDRISNCGLSIIEQPPLNGYKINVLLAFITGVRMEKYRNKDTFYARIGNQLHVFQSVRDEADGRDMEKNTLRIFEKHHKILREQGMSLPHNCVRTWLFVRDIDKNYMAAVKGRNNYFSSNGLSRDSHFIASTGIEGNGWKHNMPINIDFYSIKGLDVSQIRYPNAPDWLNPAHEYGVTFERGIGYTLPPWRCILISGTASIDKFGQIVHPGDVIAQLSRILLNIRQLLKAENATMSNICHFIAYIRDSSDYDQVKKLLQERCRHIPTVIVHGKICRPGWLAEIECMAITKHHK